MKLLATSARLIVSDTVYQHDIQSPKFKQLCTYLCEQINLAVCSDETASKHLLKININQSISYQIVKRI